MYAKIFFLIVFCIFFKGIIIYPLSDAMGFCFLIGALYCLISLSDEKNRIINILYSILSGAFILGAYYVRPVYLIAVIGCLIYMLYELIFRKRFLILILIAGAIMIMLPQILINRSNFDTYSPLIQTQNNYEGQSLYLMQLKWRMELTKYETRFFMGANLNLYLSASIVLFDKNNLYDFIRKRSNWIRYLSFVVICFIINSEIMGRYAIPLW